LNLDAMQFFTALQAQLLAPQYIGWMLQGWLMTVWMSVLVVANSMVLGLFLAAARSSGNGWVTGFAAAYVSAFRNTPLLVQLFFWYFGAPSLLPEAAREWLNSSHVLLQWGGVVLLRWPSFEFLVAWVGLVLYSTAYVGEEIRSGIRGVAPHQSSAAHALGFTRAQVLRYIVFPQALRIARPPLVGQTMNTIKNTSLAMAVGLVELSYTSRQVEAETFKTFQAFGFATLFYIATIFVVDHLGQRLERRPPAWQGARR